MVGHIDVARVLPDVFTDEHPDTFSFVVEGLEALTWIEVASFVEDVVVGQEPFVVKAGEFSIDDDGGGVAKSFFSRAEVEADEANDDHEPR